MGKEERITALIRNSPEQIIKGYIKNFK